LPANPQLADATRRLDFDLYQDIFYNCLVKKLCIQTPVIFYILYIWSFSVFLK